MRVGVLDVGANTARLLVAEAGSRGVRSVREQRTHLGLGEDIEATGLISSEKLAAAGAAALLHATAARKLGCERIEVLVTSPGRQAANAAELVRALANGAGAPVRVLGSEEEATLGFAGAVATARRLPERVAVCDVGGGSLQVVVGTPSSGALWCRSIDLGSLRLARRAFVADPPGQVGIAAARREARSCLGALEPPPADAALATGGSARSLRRLVGDRLDAAGLERTLARLAERSARAVADEYGLTLARARTLPAGAVLLLELGQLLGRDLAVAAGGLREGVVMELLREPAAA